MAARGEAQADVEVSTLVVPAWRLRWRAPELALVLGERAVALASTRRDEIDRLRAESLVVFASNRMGRGVRIADRALDALRASEKAGEQETSWRLRVELAACATAVGAPLTGFGAVRPVLAADGVPLALRAAALVQAGDCLVTIGRGPQLGMALSEADQLYVADTLLDADTRLLQRGLLHASAAAQHRRWGDLQAATDAASKGLELLANLTDPSVDSGQVRARLTLELVCALMDSNRLGEASEVGSPLLDLPVRAPSAGDVGWLRLALATRVHLPAGRVDLARGMLRDAADSAQRHQLDTLLAESLLALAHVHEVSGDLAEALTDLRSAHAAERRRARAVYAVRARLAAEFSGAHRQPVSPHEQLGSLLRPGDGRSPSAQGAMRGSQPPPDAVLAPELKQQLRQWRPVPAPKQEGPRVKRALRAAEDMTVEGISAARAHAADRWRLVQPFGADAPDPSVGAPAGGRRRAEDREPTSTELPAATPPSTETAVSATGLIAAAGAMRSGRRRAARDAAEEDTAPTPAPPTEPSAPTAPWAATPEPTPDHAAGATPEVANVLDSLQAAGLLNKRRAGGRRRAPDTEDETGQPAADQSAATPPEPPRPDESTPETPKWRVEPPQRLRSEEEQPKSPLSDLFDAPTTVHPAVGADGFPVEHPATGISAAFPKGPAIPAARTPQSPSTPEPPRAPEPPRSATSPDTATPPPGTRPTAPPHVGPDFRLGADSLGRSGFRPASDPPHQAPQAFTADPGNPTASPQPPAQPPKATPNQGTTPDFHLSANSFGRDGFRTGNPQTPTDPDPTTPQNWPPTPDLPTTTPNWAGTSRQPHPDSAPGSLSASWDQRGTPGVDSGRPQDAGHGRVAGSGSSGSGADGLPHPGFGPDTPSDWDADGAPGIDGDGEQDAGRGWAGSSPSGPDAGQGMSPQSPGWAGSSALSGSDAGLHQHPDFGAGSPPPSWGTDAGFPQDAGRALPPQPSGWDADSTPPGSDASRQRDPGFGQDSPPNWAAGGSSGSGADAGPEPGWGSASAGSEQGHQWPGGPPGTDSGPATNSDHGSSGRTPDWSTGGTPATGRSDSEPEHGQSWGSGGPSPDANRSDYGHGSDSLGGSSDWASGVGSEPTATGYRAQPDHGPGSQHGFDDSPDPTTNPGRPTDPTAPRQGTEAHHRSDHDLETGSQNWDAVAGLPDHGTDASEQGRDTGSRSDYGLGSGSQGWAAEAGLSDRDSAGSEQGRDTASPSGYDLGSGSQGWNVEAGLSGRDSAGSEQSQETAARPDYGSGSQDWDAETGLSNRDSAGSDRSRDTAPRPDHGLGYPSLSFDTSPSWDSGTPTGAGYPSGAFGAGHAVDFPRPSEHDDLTVPQPPPDPSPDHEPDQVPPVPEPDQIPPIPDPDPIPQPAPIPMPPTSSGFDLGRSRFLTSADVEDDLPELPRRVPAEAAAVDEAPDPFVTAVVVGDRTIEVPSAARASRRHKSDLSLAELLTEALVAYETGRRSDPGSDQTASEEIADWMSSAETPVSPISPDRLERAGHHVAEPERAANPEPDPRPKAEPTDSEKTTYLTPVRDLESTGPIWDSGPDGESRPPYDSWTLPES
ncbi:MAG: hypothetical protein ABIQ18_06550 [Umezawaea sp.]